MEMDFHTYVNKNVKILFSIKTKKLIFYVIKIGSEYLLFLNKFVIFF